MRIKTKLVALFAVPLLALGGIAALGFRSRTVADNSAETAHMAILTNEALQNFSNALASERLGRLDAGVNTDQQSALRTVTDEALDLTLARSSASAETQTTIQSSLEQARTAANAWVSISLYNETSDLVSEGVGSGVSQITDADLLTKLLVSSTFGESLEASDRAWLQYFASAQVDNPDVVAIATAFAQANRSQQDALGLANAEDRSRFTNALVTDPARALATTEAIALEGLAAGEFRVNANDALSQIVDRRAVLEAAHVAHNASLDTLIQDRHDTTIAERQLFGLLAAVGAIVLLGMLYTINRSISAPLDELVHRADHVANAQLPALIARLRTSRGLGDLPDPPQIKISSNDEIGDLVRAFNEMQTTAHTLATEQAISRRNVSDMFVNLGRRNQQLLQRMIGMVTDLERTEENPETLESLFALDHMVTRMRRNAESLLVLAGSQAPRQWAKPVAIEKATRGALTEVEKYQRIVINPMDTSLIQGAVVVDVTHLLAELLENALSFSDPATAVTIDGQQTADGYLMSITDHGIGMSEQELFENNQRLNNPPQLDLAPTRFLGLFVVGRLADRHGIHVHLVPGAKQGTVARIEIPHEVLAVDEEALPSSSDGVLDLADLPAVVSAMPPALQEAPLPVEPLPVDPVPTMAPEPAVAAIPLPDLNPLAPAPAIAESQAPEPLRVQQPAPLPATEPFPPIAQPASVQQLPTRSAPVHPIPQPAPVQQQPQQQIQPQVRPQAQPHQFQAPNPNPAPLHNPAPQAEGERRRPMPGIEHPTPPPAATLPTRAQTGLPTRVPGSAVPPPALAGPAPAPTPGNPQEAASGFSSMMSAFSSGVNRGLEDSDNEPERPNQ